MTYLDSETEGFVMDDLGNRTGIQTLRGGGTDDYSVDSLTNRYTAIDASPLAYDDAGNLTRDKDGYVYGYDYENRIVEIRNSADAVIAEMNYDTQGRRIRVYDAAAGTETLYYYSDQWQVLAEYTPSGTQQAYYVYGNYIDEVLFRHVIGAQAGIQDFYYLHDHLYSPAALLNPAGTVVERCEYDAYGKVSILSSDFSPLSSSAYGNRILFTGREVDSLDNGSLPLQYNRNRYLSQYMGRWYSHDPLEYLSGLNLYEYVKGGPLLNLDAYGEDPDVDWTFRVEQCQSDCVKLKNKWARAGCHGKCKKGYNIDFTVSDFADILIGASPNNPNVEYQLIEIPIAKVQTPYGTIEVVADGTITLEHCKLKNGQRATQKTLEVSITALGCVGPKLEIKTPKNQTMPKTVLNRCGECKKESSGKVTFKLKGKAGALITGSLAAEMQLHPKPEGGRTWDGSLSVEIGAYCGSEICAEVQGSVKESSYF